MKYDDDNAGLCNAIPNARFIWNPINTVETKKIVTKTEIAIFANTTLLVLLARPTIFDNTLGSSPGIRISAASRLT